jgi:hypothetical protein
MKSVIRNAALLAAAVLVLGGGKAWAQTEEVKVPFPFVVHGVTMPSGTYRVQREGDALEIQGEHGTKSAVFVGTTPATGHDPAGNQPALTFNHHDNQYWLSGVWTSAEDGLAVR